mgnify:CR=1 FL=1|tara:strand:+ start:481 stop:918 length:438 start_codon:yes stop_codon:yes gene_type:complete
MNKKDIMYLNKPHQEVVEKLMKDVKELMYYATEDEASGKYQDFLNILESVYLYSNNFHETTLKIEDDNGAVAEFIFLIPNMLFYTCIGFLTALKNESNSKYMGDYLEDIGGFCENATSELADVLIDVTEDNKALEQIMANQTIKN